MPTVTYKGPWFTRRNPDSTLPDFERGKTIEVSQAWLDQYRGRLGDSHLIDGDEPAHSDDGNDGIPDSSWRRTEIIKWLNAYGVDTAGGYKTKSSLLSLVEVVLSPEAEEVLEDEVGEEPAEEAVEEVVEEPVEEVVDEVVETTEIETTNNEME